MDNIRYCELCGTSLHDGNSRLEWIPDAHDNDDFHRLGNGKEHAHWEAFCLDTVACADRIATVAAQREAEREAAGRVEATAAAKKKARMAEWKQLVVGLVRTEAEPVDWLPTKEKFDGLDITCEKIVFPGGEVGWHVYWIGDMDGHYWLVPPAQAELAQAREEKLKRIYSWWRPDRCNPNTYPGPGVPEDQLTPDEKVEVAKRWAEKYADVEADWKRNIDAAVKPGDWKGAKGCEAWEMLKAVGAEIEVVIDQEELSAFCRRYADSGSYSSERDSLSLTVLLRAKLPETAKNKNGSIKAAVQKKLPREWQNKTRNMHIKVRIEYK